MPKFGAHILVAERAHAAEPALFPEPLNALRLGAVGPDLTLFLFDPFANSPKVRRGIDTALQVLEEIDRIQEKLEKIEEMFRVEVDLADWFTGGLSTDIKEILGLALDAGLLAIKFAAATAASGMNIQNPLLPYVEKAIRGDPSLLDDVFSDPRFLEPSFYVSAADNFGVPFRYFGHPYTNDPPWTVKKPDGVYDEWWWMDLLHYRRTGSFAQALAAHADSAAKRAYAAGYMTHVAGDITGHPYVNAIVHGPFRSHAYRHIVLEGLADTWVWDYLRGGDIATSRLDQLISVNGREIGEIAHQIRMAMEATYADILPRQFSEGYPTEKDLQAAYLLMRRYLKLASTRTTQRPEPPPDDLDEIIQEMFEMLARNDPGDFPGGGDGDPVKWLAAVFAWFSKGVALLIMVLTVLPALAARIAAAPARWALYLVKLAIYMIVSGLRTMMALMGYGYTARDDFNIFGFLGSWISTSVEGAAYPAEMVPLKPPMYWLAEPHYLGANVEQPATAVNLLPNHSRPDVLFDPRWTIDAAHLALLQQLQQAADPNASIRIERALQQANSSGFGNAVDLSRLLVSGGWPVADLDLDGDRGYGFRTWEALPPNSRYVR